LGITGVFQFVGICVQKEGSNISTDYFGCFANQFPTFVVDPCSAHAGALRTLTWKCESEH
jgi:hypothetical protein